MAGKKSSEDVPGVFQLILIFVAGFTVFTFVGFVILVILLSLGILPAY